MKKTAVLICLLLVACSGVRAVDQVSADSILTILQQKPGPQQHKQLILSIRYYFSGLPADSLGPAKRRLDRLLNAHPVTDAEAIGLLAETMYLMERKNYIAAEKTLVRGIRRAGNAGDHYLLYAYFTQLAFIQTLYGNTTEAVRSFRQARREAIGLNDAYLQVLVDINISDIYLQNKLHNQSLLYLDQAQALITRRRLNEPNFMMMVRVNKAENYFHMGNADSVAKYSRQLITMKIPNARLYTFQQRSLYTLLLLRRQYDRALIQLDRLKKDSHYLFDATDEQNEADALFLARRLDAARAAGRRLLADPARRNHPEVTLPLYEMLARIAVTKQEKDLAIRRFDESLQMAKAQLVRLSEVDTIAAGLKLDDMQSSYIRREEAFRRERLWLIFSVVTISLVLVAGGILYRGVRQKRHFERLLFEARKDELSFINSHQVRRHLSNILGIVDTIRHSDNRHVAYIEAEAHLLSAAEDLDRSIRAIADKLNN